MKRIVECVPNFSEGRDEKVIEAIVSAIEKGGAQVLDVDMGSATNRTVVTMAGALETVEESAFLAIKKACEMIDMRKHKGEHPRVGACDVCPFVPVQGVTMRDCIEIARRVGKRVGDELEVPVFLYAEAATTPERRKLEWIREGEYEGLARRLLEPNFKPDFGPAKMNEKSGACVVGAREFLIAYNINLNTKQKVLASRIAVKLREAGGIARAPDHEPIVGPDGAPIKVKGLFHDLKAVGWFIEEYGIAQVSINVTNYRKTPLHLIYEETKRIAKDMGVEVTGSEIVGLVPKEALFSSARFYLRRQGVSGAMPENELIHIAVKSLGLNDAKPFDASAKVIEYRLEADKGKGLCNKSLKEFCDQVSSDSPVPGGGSVAATSLAMGCALGAMALNISVAKEKDSGKKLELEDIASWFQGSKAEALGLCEEDSEAFRMVLEARKKGQEAFDIAVRTATLVPLRVLRLANECAKRLAEARDRCFRGCISDLGVALAMCENSARGAFLNVLINLPEIRDKTDALEIHKEALALYTSVTATGGKALDAVVTEIGAMFQRKTQDSKPS
jgi:glutamate formiminotransferase/formiminotetrahydrofolate cyclodeaminase